MSDWGVPATSQPAEASGGFVPDADWNGGDNHDDTFATAQEGQEDVTGVEEQSEYTGCRFCGSLQHKARECEQKPADFGRCFLCQEDGHSKKDCPNKPPSLCKLCREPGHDMEECTVNRLFKAFNITSEAESQDAWESLLKADASKDLDDIKAATFAYAKSYPDLTVVDLEAAFRESGLNTYLIAKEQTISVSHTIVNFQGQPDQKFVVTFQFSPKPRRARQDSGWPADPEENIERLKEAGFVMDSFVTLCRNCDGVGHTSKNCPEEKREVDRVKLECTICGAIGSHRARDCTQPRKQPGKPRECRNCGSTEHMAKDCDQAPACRNCDSTEHVSKDCDKPKDWSRVTCNNCGEKGHGNKRCPQPPKESDGGGEDGGSGDGNDENNATASADNGGW